MKRNCVNQAEQDRALLAMLTGNRPAASNDESWPKSTHDDIDTVLRAMGYGRPQRERLRYSRRPGPAGNTRHQAVTLKRFAFYIRQQLPGLQDEEAAHLAGRWCGFTKYDLELAQRWWASGINPADTDQLVKFAEAGLDVSVLAQVVCGRTIAEHLKAGSSVDWCLSAIRWAKSA
jgi:hypothetical protein